MAWGDVFKDLDEQGDDHRRFVVVQQGLLPGALITCGTLGGKPFHVWSFPEMTSDSFDVMPGWGLIISVDCESDPSMDWLMLWFHASDGRHIVGWVPTGLVKPA